MSLPTTTTGFKPKSFWERPEGTTGMIFAALGLGGVGALLYVLLPFIITLLQNTLTAIGLGLTLFCILWVLFDKRFQTFAWYLYKSAMRKITQIFIEIDPIGILKNYVDHLVGEKKKMDTQISNLRGQIRVLQNAIAKNEQDRQEALSMANIARTKGEKQVFTLKARKAGRLQDSNTTLQTMLNKMELLYRVLQKMRETAEIFIEDIADEVEVKERERKMIMAGHSAIKSAMAIMRGDSDKADMFHQTMEFLTEDYGRKLGEIEDFVEMSASFIASVDLQNGVYEENALKMLEQWEQRSDSLLLPAGDKQALIAEAYNPSAVLDLDAPEPVPVRRREDRKSDHGASWGKLID